MIFFALDTNILPHVTLTGKADIPSPNCHFKRTPQEYILYFITYGKMILIEGDITYTLSKGDCILLDPSRTHIGSHTDSTVGYYYVHFTSDIINEIDIDADYIKTQQIADRIGSNSSEQLLLPKTTHFTDLNATNVLQIFEKLCYMKEQVYKRSLSHCLLMELLILYAQNIHIPSPALSSTTENIILQLIDFIQNNTHRRITSKDIEEHFHMNFDYLNRLFKKSTNMTLIHFANYCRITESKKMLKSGLYSVREVAWKMGFPNEFYFSRIYKKFEGVAPSQDEAI